MPLIDVVIPCYNYARYLSESVISVLCQRDVSLRVLIIDDASSDDTETVALSLARGDSRVEYRRHTDNRGHIATYNEGIDWATSKYLMILSADDYLLPGALARATEIMEKHPDVGFVFGKAREEHIDSSEIVDPLASIGNRPRGSVLSGLTFIQMSGGRNIVPTPTVIVRTSLQKEVGGYRAALPHAADMEMYLRMAARAQVGFVDDLQAVRRQHESNMSKSYNVSTMLPDLEQRRLVFQYFLLENRKQVSRSLERRLLRSLAIEGLNKAGQAFNEGNLRDVPGLVDFSIRVSPGVRLSWPWAKVVAKAILGARASRAARSLRSYFQEQAVR